MKKFVKSSGRVEFRYSKPGAGQVFLVGSFNAWNPRSHPMARGADGQWRCRLDLPAGEHQFRFLSVSRGSHKDGTGPREEAYSSSGLATVVVRPPGDPPGDGETEPQCPPVPASLPEGLLPLSTLEAALIRVFRKLPDHEWRSAFVDVLEESVYS
jgi:hypothetical protein